MPAAEPNRQLPSPMVHPAFGEVNVRRRGTAQEVTFTVQMEPQGADAEGWQTGVALDASASMRSAFGRSLLGEVPATLMNDYRQKGWLREVVEDGRSVYKMRKEATEDAVRRRVLKYTDNVMEPRAREFIAYLAGNLDADGGTTVIYWACGDGSGTEVVGDFTAEQCAKLELRGPKQATFGTGTHLAPAVRYFVERFRDAARGMYVFLTDGKLDDLDAVKKYTTRLAQEIAAGRRNPVKCVLIGLGPQIDEGQMEQLDDLETGTDVDVWDHKISAEMRGLVEIFAEVVGENQIVAPTARLYDDAGRPVKEFTDGMPAKVTFTLPAQSAWFELDVGGERIRQPLR